MEKISCEEISLDDFKSVNDKKSYLFTNLLNGIDCLLISNVNNQDRNISSGLILIK